MTGEVEERVETNVKSNTKTRDRSNPIPKSEGTRFPQVS
jgi:hypothetical protein